MTLAGCLILLIKWGHNMATKTVELTDHARKRMRERLHVDDGKAKHIAWQAIMHGKQHKDTTGELSAYLTETYLKTGRTNNMRIYQGFLFLFRDNTLITVYELPKYYKENNGRDFICKYSPKEWRVMKTQLSTLKRVLKENKGNSTLVKRYRKDIKNLERKMYS